MRSFMKKIITLILTLIVALSLGCALTACKDKPAESVGSGKESVGETGGESDAAAAMSEEVFATFTGRARFGGNYAYDHTVDEYDKKFGIVTVFGGENI